MTAAKVTARAWIDGAAQGNPGDAGFGIYLEHETETVTLTDDLDKTANNVAKNVGCGQNSRADSLANQATHQRSPLPTWLSQRPPRT